MSIEEKGFLSLEIAAYVDKHRAENRAWFSLATDLNSVAQQLLLEVPLDDETFPSVLLFVRGLSEGIVRVTRHPFLIGVGLWAVVHLIANGDLASFIFFGSLAVTALAGTVSIDAKRRRALGRAWQSFAAQTSIVPFAAIAAGRTRFKLDEIAAWQWAAAIITYVLFLGGHSHIFGVS